jgi:tetratricopeptide (TPR) repeat protein
LNADPTVHPDAYYQRGLLHLKNRRLEQAIADFTKAVELNPSFGEAYRKRGDAYRAKGMNKPRPP